MGPKISLSKRKTPREKGMRKAREGCIHIFGVKPREKSKYLLLHERIFERDVFDNRRGKILLFQIYLAANHNLACTGIKEH